MDSFDLDEIKKAGFIGFVSVKQLFLDSSILPPVRGIYMVLYLNNKTPEFLKVGSGGHFKDKNPNVSINELKSNWVGDVIVVYIGKAGKEGSAATLRSRLGQYLRFGQGRKVGHWGGRLIWQLKNSSDLIVCWKSLPSEDSRTIEANLIREFVSHFSRRPFANLAD